MAELHELPYEREYRVGGSVGGSLVPGPVGTAVPCAKPFQLQMATDYPPAPRSTIDMITQKPLAISIGSRPRDGSVRIVG